MPVYKKLVRDQIPAIIEASGQRAKWYVFSEQAYLKRTAK